MGSRSTLENITFVFAVLVLGLLVAGSQSCDELREDFEIGAQANVSDSPSDDDDDSASASGDDDDDSASASGDDDDDSASASGDDDDDSASASGDDDDDNDSSPSPSASETASPSTSSLLIGAMSEIAKTTNSESNDPLVSNIGAETQSGVSRGQKGNWLGGAFSNRDAEDGLSGVDADTDGDGFADWQEQELGSDPRDRNSFTTPVTVLRDLLVRNNDSDGDGLTDGDDLNAQRADSDGDKKLDGCETRSGSDPSNPSSQPQGDFDNDGLSFDLESRVGSNSRNPDTDGDGLSDCLEVSLGSGLLDMDSDNDGIFDGTEVKLQSDPLAAEPLRHSAR